MREKVIERESYLFYVSRGDALFYTLLGACFRLVTHVLFIVMAWRYCSFSIRQPLRDVVPSGYEASSHETHTLLDITAREGSWSLLLSQNSGSLQPY